MLPNMVLDQILDAAELFPPEIVKKNPQGAWEGIVEHTQLYGGEVM